MSTAKELKAKLASRGICLKGNHSKGYLLAKLSGIILDRGGRVLGNTCTIKCWEILGQVLSETKYNEYYHRHKNKAPIDQKKAIRRILRNLRRSQLLKDIQNED